MTNFLTEEQVAEQLQVSLSALRRWRLEQRGPQFVKVGSLVRYKPEELSIWIASLPVGGHGAMRARMDSGTPKRLAIGQAK